tara:strand:- start:552 stop:737 length:186 start_codon:yes stop_codon:yes gene_type:complete
MTLNDIYQFITSTISNVISWIWYDFDIISTMLWILAIGFVFVVILVIGGLIYEKITGKKID